MRNHAKILGLAICMAVLTVRANEGGSYASIVERNPFGLKSAMTDLASKPAPEAKKPGKVYFTGILEENGVSKACLAIQSNPPGSPAKYTYLALAPGERDAALELVSLNATRGAEAVEVRCGGETVSLTFKDNPFRSIQPPAATNSPGLRPVAISL